MKIPIQGYGFLITGTDPKDELDVTIHEYLETALARAEELDKRGIWFDCWEIEVTLEDKVTRLKLGAYLSLDDLRGAMRYLEAGNKLGMAEKKQ